MGRQVQQVPGRDADSRRIGFKFGEFAENSIGLRICCKFAMKFTGLRIRCEFGLRMRTKSRWRRLCGIGDFLDFCSANFSTVFGIERLKLGRILVHYKDQLSINPPLIPVRFFKCQIDENNVAGTEGGTIQTWILSSKIIVQSNSLQVSKCLEKSANQKFQNGVISFLSPAPVPWLN